ncbi:hypothetical protein ACJMQP_04205 [Rhodopseudomonas palustris]
MESESEIAEGGFPFVVRMVQRWGRKVYLLAKGAAWLVLSCLGALVQSYGVADVTGFVREAFANSARLPLLVVGAVGAYLIIRQLTEGPKGFSAKADLNDGD